MIHLPPPRGNSRGNWNRRWNQPRNATSQPQGVSEHQRNAINSPVFKSQVEAAGLDMCQIKDPQSAQGENPYRKRSDRTPCEVNIFQELLAKKEDIDTVPEYKTFQQLSFDEQINHFMKQQPMQMTDKCVRWQIALDIMYLLRREFPQCQVYPFGSLLTGMGEASSDVDVFVDINGDWGQRLQQDPQRRKTLESTQWKVKEVFKQANCPHNPARRFAKEILPMGNHILFVRMVHFETSIKCDVSFTSPLSLTNSRLQLLYMNLNPVVPPFLLFLRFWAKFHGVASGEMKFKYFAVNLLGLVYLMEAGVLPSIQQLQSWADETEYFDGWNASYCKNVPKIKENFTAASRQPALKDLLQGFFKMVEATDVSRVVFSPYLGKLVERRDFLEDTAGRALFPPSFQAWLQKRSNLEAEMQLTNKICIQDPFCHNFNVGGNVRTLVGDLFTLVAGKTAEALENIQNNAFYSLTDPLVRGNVRKREIDGKLAWQYNNLKVRDGGKWAAEILEIVTPQSVVEDSESHQLYWVLRLPLENDFKALFLQELVRCGMLPKVGGPADKVRVGMRLTTLWKMYAENFLESFFTTGLLLDIVPVGETVIDGENFEVVVSERSAEAEGEKERQRGWNLQLLPFREFESISKERFYQSPAHVENIRRKVAELPMPTNEIIYKVFQVSVDYPFWNRPAGAGNDSEKHRGAVPHKNPIETEAQLAAEARRAFKMRVEEGHEVFQPFTMTVLVKFEARKISDEAVTRPSMAVVVQDSFEDGDNRNQANEFIASVLNTTFPSFQLHHLFKWINAD